jgi:cytoskeleton protein RodZ
MNELDAMGESAPADESDRSAPGFGYALAQARVRAGLSLEQTAARIRLHPRQLRALENEDLAALPAAAYVAGFVRNYARELKIDPGPLIEDLNAKLRISGLGTPAPDLGPGGAVPVRVLDDRGWRHLVLAGIVIALVCAGLIGAWMAHADLRLGSTAARRAQAPAVGAPAAPVPAAQAPSAGEPPQQAPGAAGAPKDGVEAAPAADAAVSSTAAAPVAADTAPPAGTGALPAAAQPAVPTPGSTPAGAAAEGSGAAPLAPAPGAATGLVLRFTDRSWFEVSRPNGRVLMSRNGEAGSIELLNAAPPLQLVVGRAGAVQVEFRGRPVDLKPYVNNNGVARLTLADGRAPSGGQNSR